MLGRRAFLFGCACCAAPRAFAADAAPALSITPIADNVWRHTTWKLLPGGRPFPSNGLIVRGSRSALVIDTTWPVDQMASLMRHVNDVIAVGQRVHLVVTHAHDDRMSGLDVAREFGARSLAHVLTQADAPARGLPPADEIWRGRRKRIALGGRSVELYYPGPAHTRDNVVAFVPDVGVLFGGCQVRPAEGDGLGNIADAAIGAWPGATRRLIARYGNRARVVVPGHGEPGDASLLRHTLDLAEAAVAQSE